MGLFWSNSWSLALIFCTHAKKNPTSNLSRGRARGLGCRKSCGLGPLAPFANVPSERHRSAPHDRRARPCTPAKLARAIFHFCVPKIMEARPLCHLQYPVAYLSHLQRILPAARWELYFMAAAPMGRQPRPRHTAKALACLRGLSRAPHSFLIE